MTTKSSLYRDPDKGKIAGVCAGLAEHFGWELWLVRIIFVTGFLLSGSFFLIGYIIGWFILDKKPGSQEKITTAMKGKHWKHKGQGKGWYNTPEEEMKVEVKSKVWQAGEPPQQAFHDIQSSYSKLETRLRGMETYVTSSEFQLNREISKL